MYRTSFDHPPPPRSHLSYLAHVSPTSLTPILHACLPVGCLSVLQTIPNRLTRAQLGTLSSTLDITSRVVHKSMNRPEYLRSLSFIVSNRFPHSSIRPRWVSSSPVSSSLAQTPTSRLRSALHPFVSVSRALDFQRCCAYPPRLSYSAAAPWASLLGQSPCSNASSTTLPTLPPFVSGALSEISEL